MEWEEFSVSQFRVFIVEDDQDFAESLAEVLEVHGYDVTIASSGEEAIERFRVEDFDITFMDVRLPGKNGVESFLEVRHFKPDAKVVMMTGYSVPQLLDEAVRKGAWAVLHKPFDMDQVLRLVEKIQPCGVVLLADDDPDFVDGIREIIEESGYQILVAHDGKKACEKVREGNVDVLVLDLCLPILSGLDVFLELQRSGDAVPTIIVTGYPREESAGLDTLRSLEVMGILSKPFDPRDLLSILERLKGASKD